MHRMHRLLALFVFDESALRIDEDADFVGKMPAGITNKPALLEAIRVALEFPEWFGHNWDALDDCLRDLSWINQRRVILVHCEVPRMDRGELRVYLDALAHSVAEWQSESDHELVVVFPEDDRYTLQAALV